MKQIKTIIPLSLFKQKSSEYLSLMEIMGETVMLTVHGRGAFVVHHLNSYMDLKELAEYGLHQKSLDHMMSKADEM